MKNENFDLDAEVKHLVLERFKTLSPRSKIMLGDQGEYSVGDIIKHVKKGDEFGKRIIKVQLKMLQVLAGSA
jgi:hypothetical protein